uniref:Butyrobetaine (gamma), 2-oxoglutarate dioxygenase (gamma-butyrobetaine hydroxylase) 1 n=1 Tax=Astyanax mexicanus TaxID=7994 RepID=A0A8B9LMJ8_ASTMX
HWCTARAQDRERLLQVEWDDGSCSLYPFTWLRDNCQCPRCTLQSAQARSLLLTDLDVHTGVDQVQITENNKVSITWPDQHSSEFEPDWLKKRCFSPEARQARQEELFLNERDFWDSGLQIPTLDFEEVLHDDKAALDWLMALRRVGIVYLKGAPLEQGQVARLSQRIGYLRLTFYGYESHTQKNKTILIVIDDLKHLNITDFIFLRCKVTCFFKQIYKCENSAIFCLIPCITCVTYFVCVCVCVSVDSEGRVVRINYNNATRDSTLDLPLDQVQPFYSSLKSFVELMNQPENVFTYRMEPGDLVTFDNWRLLHGRKSYLSGSINLRHLEGAYLDWDEVMSRLRLLRKSELIGDNWS